jgi:hypothetical protein
MSASHEAAPSDLKRHAAMRPMAFQERGDAASAEEAVEDADTTSRARTRRHAMVIRLRRSVP